VLKSARIRRAPSVSLKQPNLAANSKEFIHQVKRERKKGGWVPLPRSGVLKSKKSRIKHIEEIENAELDAPRPSEWFAVLCN
jgi:hypothetical protein